MTKEELIDAFYNNHKTFIDYINAVPDTDFIVSKAQKWAPAQQLEHVFLCLQPLAQVLGSKSFIEQKFGVINRATLGYDDVIATYKTALENGGKAPGKFVPEKVELTKKAKLIASTTEIVKTINEQLNTYSETELNTLVLPHPLLGNLTIREMFYLMAYHAMHHLNQTKLNM